MNSNEIRQRYLKFFEDKGHKVVPSDLLVPRNDPTLLFTGAGMNQFKEQFMGKNITFKRAASCQKCLRTGDVENVGRTPRHHTFFEMLGNFSFGDYFKKEAISWGWEFMTKEMGIPEEKLWVSVYEEDDESYSIWLNDIGVPEKKIVKLGSGDNFWPADAPSKGPNGPCGPCSEIFYDWGTEKGCGKTDCSPACDCGRFVEVWNLVFTEFEREETGKLKPLPNKNIDTGMGLERMVSVVQGKRSNFETDLFEPVVREIKKVLKTDGKELPESDCYLIADHTRAVIFAIADGVSPSNEKQGYVIRKLIRRAWLRGSVLGEPFLFKIVPVITRMFRDIYPDIEEKREHISAIVKEEEKRFTDTLESAMPVLEGIISSGGKTLTGEQIFKLVDTYGLPLDVIMEETDKNGIAADTEGFEKLMDQRREQSRQGSDISSDFIFKPDNFSDAPNPDNADGLPLKTSIAFMLKGDGPVDMAGEGDRIEIITSPQSSELYAEAGGQVGDTGSIVKDNGRMEIVDVFETSGKKVLQAIVQEGTFETGNMIELDIDRAKKMRTAANHTATHLLQAALRDVLGDHVKQSGSYVDDKRLRFDFTHMKKIPPREIAKVEDIVNGWIDKSIDVCKEVKNVKEAKEEGALSFFGEKYGETVRVVSVGKESKELCGGTHVDNTADIKLVKITGESSVASGIRRIEAVTGANAEEWLKETLKRLLRDTVTLKEDAAGVEESILGYVEDILNGKVSITSGVMRDFDEKIKPAFQKVRETSEKMAKKRKKEEAAGIFNEAREVLDKAAGSPVTLGEINFVPVVLEGLEMGLLRKAAGYLGGKVSSGVLLLGSGTEDKVYLICSVTSDLTGKGINAMDIINGISGCIDGSGGGKPDFAQAGGKNVKGLPDAMEKARCIIEERG